MLKRLQSFLLLFMVCNASIFAATYDDDVLSMYAKLSPRFVLMSTLKDELNDSIEICLLHDDVDAQVASVLQKKIIDNYKNGIKSYSVGVKKVLYTNHEECARSDMLFLFTTNEQLLKKSIDFSHEKNILTISYDSKVLESGVDISLFIGRKVVPYINVNSVTSKKIELDNILLRISKIYKNSTGSVR